MRRLIAVCAWLAIAACESSATGAHVSPPPSPSVDRSPTRAAVAVAGGCATTQVYKDGEPDWLTRAGDNNNPNELPYFITSPPIAAGFLFAHPLKGGRAANPNNKILWVVGVPRAGNDLEVEVSQTGTAGESLAFPADSGPGDIYPSIVDVPNPGCWHFLLSWGPNKATADLIYT